VQFPDNINNFKYGQIWQTKPTNDRPKLLRVKEIHYTDGSVTFEDLEGTGRSWTYGAWFILCHMERASDLSRVEDPTGGNRIVAAWPAVAVVLMGALLYWGGCHA
jgi:hypothetical protein